MLGHIRSVLSWRVCYLVGLGRSVIALVFISSAHANISVPAPEQTPQTVSIAFAADATVQFTLIDGRLASLSGHIGKIQTNASFDDCKTLRNLRLDNFKLIRDDLKRQDPQQSITLLFDVGSDDDRRFGQLPRVQLTFDARKINHALITRRTSDSGYFSDQLCPGRIGS
jgi:hypothetical protein